jgi:hypothetical protein
MSHALVIVAISPDDVRARMPDEELRAKPFSEWPTGVDTKHVAEAIMGAVQHQMEPFDENGSWFREGSRWDWWTIGGRYDGRLLGENVIQRSRLTQESMDSAAEARVRGWWPEYEKERNERGNDSPWMKMVWDLPDDATLDAEIAKAKGKRISAWAFLRNRRWCEGGRMGFFGQRTITECDAKARNQVGEEYTGRCIHEDKESGAKVVTFQEEGDDWSAKFYDRFIADLPPDTFLVVVDYHV